MSLLIADRRLPWKRYWVPWDGNVNSGWDGTGFITEPTGLWGRTFNPDLKTIGEVIDRPFVVLSGLPGMGKTQAITDLQDNWAQIYPAEDMVYVEGRTLDNTAAVYRTTVDSPRWKSILETGREIRLLIDGVDEAIMRQLDLVSALIQALHSQPLNHIRVVLVCRTAEWNGEDAKKFALLWKQVDKSHAEPLAPGKDFIRENQKNVSTALVWELCHLRREDAEIAATACHVDPKAFLKSVARRRIEGLAARPITLKMLLEEFKANPNANATFHDLYCRSIYRLCGEINEDRAQFAPSYPPKEQVYRAASRVAACLIFGRKSVIVKSKAASENPALELLLTDVEGDDVADNSPFKITSSILKFTLDTPLFNSRGRNYGFEQKTYTDFLASNYLSTCTTGQLRSLLCASIDGRDVVSPHLAEMAARVAVLHEAWCRHLCEHDPEVLLRTDVSPLSDQLKELVVRSYLAKVVAEEAFDHQGLSKFYASLNHPKLAEQLRPYINNTSWNLVVRRVAVLMAGDCRLTELENELWALARANDPCLRWIGPALRKLTGIHATGTLMEILRGDFPAGTFRTLSGVAIEILVPAHLAVRDVLSFLESSPRKREVDAHHVASNYHLIQYLVPADLAPALQWLMGLDRAFDSLHSLNRLAEHVFEMALKHLDDPAISQAAVAVWVQCVEKHLPLPSGRDHYDKEAPSRGLGLLKYRQAFVAAIIQSEVVAQIPRFELFELFDGLLTTVDSSWLLEKLDAAADAEGQAWSRICGAHLGSVDARLHADLVLRLYDRWPELRANLPPLEEGLDIVASLELYAERGRRESDRRSQEQRSRRPPLQKRRDAIADLVGHPDITKHTEWVELSQWLWVRAELDTTTETDDHSDITTSPGWLEADEETRIQIKDSAKQFLLLNRETPRRINFSSSFSTAAYLAIRLFWLQLRSEPHLAESIASQWPRSIFNAFRDESNEHSALVAWCYRRRPRLGMAILLAKMKDYNENGLVDFALEPYRLCWDKYLANGVVCWILKRKVTIRNLFRLVHWLVIHDRPSAEALIDKTRVAKQPLSTQAHESVFALSAWLLMPDRYWLSLRSIIENAPCDQIRAILLDSASELSEGDRPILASLSDQQLGDLGKLVFRVFPSRLDPIHRSGEVYDVRKEDNLAAFRQTILDHLVSRGTSTACDAIFQIAQDNESDRLWIKWRYKEALRAIADKQVPARSSLEITRIVLSTTAILIDSENDLARAVVASLERLEVQMRAHSTEWRALWNEEDHKPARARKHPSGLEPKIETAFTDVVARWLEQDLGPANGLILNREVEISKDKIVDLMIDVTAKGSGRPLRVPVECKRCIHPEVPTALQNQLIDLYMAPHRLTHGIYLIGWYRGAWQPSKKPRWNPGSLTIARRQVETWAQNASIKPIEITACVLDCSGEPMSKQE